MLFRSGKTDLRFESKKTGTETKKHRVDQVPYAISGSDSVPFTFPLGQTCFLGEQWEPELRQEWDDMLKRRQAKIDEEKTKSAMLTADSNRTLGKPPIASKVNTVVKKGDDTLPYGLRDVEDPIPDGISHWPGTQYN